MKWKIRWNRTCLMERIRDKSPAGMIMIQKSFRLRLPQRLDNSLELMKRLFNSSRCCHLQRDRLQGPEPVPLMCISTASPEVWMQLSNICDVYVYVQQRAGTYRSQSRHGLLQVEEFIKVKVAGGLFRQNLRVGNLLVSRCLHATCRLISWAAITFHYCTG